MIVQERLRNINNIEIVELFVYDNEKEDLEGSSFFVDTYYELEKFLNYWGYCWIRFGNYYKCIFPVN